MKSNTSFSAIPDILLEEQESIEDNELFADEILDRKYMAISAQEVVDSLDNLTAAEKNHLLKVLERCQGLFYGRLGKHPTAKISIELKLGDERSWRKPYQLPYKRREVFHKDLDSMIEDGALIPLGNPQWGIPSFIIPKKNGRVIWISDFIRLNEIIIRKPCALPRIQDIMNRRGKYKHFTKIDLYMMFYCFELDDQEKQLCIIYPESGKYAYTRLPMGVNISQDIAQSYMAEMLHGIDCKYYMDDVGIWSDG